MRTLLPARRSPQADSVAIVSTVSVREKRTNKKSPAFCGAFRTGLVLPALLLAPGQTQSEQADAQQGERAGLGDGPETGESLA